MFSTSACPTVSVSKYMPMAASKAASIVTSSFRWSVRNRGFFGLINLIPLSPDCPDEAGIRRVVFELFAQVHDMYHDGVVGRRHILFMPHTLVDLRNRNDASPMVGQELQNRVFRLRQF